MKDGLGCLGARVDALGGTRKETSSETTRTKNSRLDMAWWAGVGWGSRIASVESRLTKKGDRDVSYKTKGANCQGGPQAACFSARSAVLFWLGRGGEGGSGSEEQDGLWFRRARHTWKSPGREWGARIISKESESNGKWAAGDGKKPPEPKSKSTFPTRNDVFPKRV